MDLSKKRDLILMSLIIKGVLLFSTLIYFLYIVLTVDEMSSPSMFIHGLAFGFLVYFLKRTISKNDFKRIFFLTKEERREFDNETI